MDVTFDWRGIITGFPCTVLYGYARGFPCSNHNIYWTNSHIWQLRSQTFVKLVWYSRSIFAYSDGKPMVSKLSELHSFRRSTAKIWVHRTESLIMPCSWESVHTIWRLHSFTQGVPKISEGLNHIDGMDPVETHGLRCSAKKIQEHRKVTPYRTNSWDNVHAIWCLHSFIQGARKISLSVLLTNVAHKLTQDMPSHTSTSWFSTVFTLRCFTDRQLTYGGRW